MHADLVAASISIKPFDKLFCECKTIITRVCLPIMAKLAVADFCMLHLSTLSASYYNELKGDGYGQLFSGIVVLGMHVLRG